MLLINGNPEIATVVSLPRNDKACAFIIIGMISQVEKLIAYVSHGK